MQDRKHRQLEAGALQTASHRKTEHPELHTLSLGYSARLSPDRKKNVSFGVDGEKTRHPGKEWPIRAPTFRPAVNVTRVAYSRRLQIACHLYPISGRYVEELQYLSFTWKMKAQREGNSPLLTHPVRYAVMPRVAQGGNDVGISLPPGYLRFQRGSACSRAGVCVARYALPPAALHPRRGGKTGSDLIRHHNHRRKSVREAPVPNR